MLQRYVFWMNVVPLNDKLFSVHNFYHLHMCDCIKESLLPVLINSTVEPILFTKLATPERFACLRDFLWLPVALWYYAQANF